MIDQQKESSLDLKKSSEIVKFKPTPAMYLFRDTALRLMSDNVSEITKEAGIDESNYYKWRHIEGFNEWFMEQWQKGITGYSWRLEAIGFRNAKRDHRYWQDMMKATGRLGEGKANNNLSRKLTVEEFFQ